MFGLSQKRSVTVTDTVSPALTGVTVRFPNGGRLAIPDMTFDAPCTIVTGDSGCGKSTALKVLAGYLRQERGHVVRPAGRIAYVSQRFHLLPEANVLDNVLISGQLAGVSVSRAEAAAMLDRFGMGDHLKAMPGTLSCGQAQRAAIACAIVVKAGLVLLDEPTSGIGIKNAAKLAEVIGESLLLGDTRFIIVTHDNHLDGLPHKAITYPTHH